LPLIFINPKASLMPNSTRYIVIITLCTLFYSNILKAQPRKGDFINASVGLGISTSEYEEDGGGIGFYAQGEYVKAITKWFGIRPYAGIIITSPDRETDLEIENNYKVTAKAFSFGGKFRVAAPIPWIAPYIETGLGASIGSFETFTPSTNIKKNGILMHIPFSLGLAVGPKHNVEIAFTYLFTPAAEQFSGAAAFGLSFPLDR